MRLRLPVRLAAAALAVAAATSVTAACGSSGSSGPGPGKAAAGAALPVRVDAVGGGTTTVRDASRILPLTGDLADIVFTLGLADKVVGVDDSGATLPDAKGKPVVGYQRALNAEGIVALRPSVVLATSDAGPSAVVDQVRSTGVPVVLIPKGDRLEDAGARIRATAKALGVPAKGGEIAARTEKEIADARARAAATPTSPRVAFLYMRGTRMPAQLGGKGSRGDLMIEAAHAVDAGTDAGVTGFRTLTPEALVAARPEVILTFTGAAQSIGGQDAVFELPGVEQTPAGRARRIVMFDDLDLGALGPRTGRTLDMLVTALHG